MAFEIFRNLQYFRLALEKDQNLINWIKRQNLRSFKESADSYSSCSLYWNRSEMILSRGVSHELREILRGEFFENFLTLI